MKKVIEYLRGVSGVVVTLADDDAYVKANFTVVDAGTWYLSASYDGFREYSVSCSRDRLRPRRYIIKGGEEELIAAFKRAFLRVAKEAEDIKTAKAVREARKNKMLADRDHAIGIARCTLNYANVEGQVYADPNSWDGIFVEAYGFKMTMNSALSAQVSVSHARKVVPLKDALAILQLLSKSSG